MSVCGYSQQPPGSQLFKLPNPFPRYPMVSSDVVERIVEVASLDASVVLGVGEGCDSAVDPQEARRKREEDERRRRDLARRMGGTPEEKASAVAEQLRDQLLEKLQHLRQRFPHPGGAIAVQIRNLALEAEVLGRLSSSSCGDDTRKRVRDLLEKSAAEYAEIRPADERDSALYRLGKVREVLGGAPW